VEVHNSKAGGYTIRNVARCWTYETAVLTETELSNELPYNEYLSHYGPDFKLHPPIVSQADNMNTRAYLENIRIKVSEHLRYLQGAPSIQMQHIPPTMATFMADDDIEVSSANVRRTTSMTHILMKGIRGPRICSPDMDSRYAPSHVLM
jgi:hypothetical protein